MEILKTLRKSLPILCFGFGLIYLIVAGVLLRFSFVTDHLYHATVKDPQRRIPLGPVIVAPADGTVLYVKRVQDGLIPHMVKRGVSVPVTEHFKLRKPGLREGVLIGIYMNTHGVHINRAPNHGVLKKQIVFNGPHLDMTAAERKIILSQLLPGWISFKKILGLSPYGIEDDADYILKSARETLIFKDDRGSSLYITRIADYYVGKILTWVREGQVVRRGQKLGLITWGSQTDLFFETSAKARIKVKVGDYVYAGQTVIANY